MTALEPDRDQLEIFVDGLFRHAGTGGWVSLRSFYEDQRLDEGPFRVTPTSLTGGLNFIVEAAVDDAYRAANAPRGVVFCPPIAVFSNNKHAREQDLAEGLAISVECDQHPGAARAKLESILGPATFVVRSGGVWVDPQTGELCDKLHLHWRLKEPAQSKDDLAKLKQARDIATTLVGGDASNKPVCHPIRWAGSWHKKSAPRLCETVDYDLEREIDLKVALEKLLAVAPEQAQAQAQGPTAGNGSGKDPVDWDEGFHNIVSGKSYHPVLTSLSSSFVRYGMPELAARKTLHALMACSNPSDPERQRRRDVELGKLRSTVHSAYQKFATAPALLDPWKEVKMPDFPFDTLPVSVRVFVEEQSSIMGGCPSALALSTLCAISGAIDHRFKVKMMRHGGWWERPRLWGLLVGDPSTKKTPIINAATRPLERRQREIYRNYQAQLRAHIEAGGKPDDKDAPEKPPHHVVYDPTIEALGEILERSPAGVLVKRDEIPGWIGGMEKYAGAARGSDRAFWLKAFDGGGYAFHRIKRGEIYIPNLSVSLIGGIQPARLAELQGLTSDGLLQRFMVAIIRTANRGRDVESKESEYTKLIYKLLAEPAQRFTLTDDALEQLNKLLDHLHELERMSGSLAEGFQSFVGKLPGYAGSLALILHLTENLVRLPSFIGGTIIERVERIILEFTIPHATEFYRLGGAADQLKRIASFILTSDLDRFRAADFTTNVRDLRGLPLFALNERVSPLVAGGWLDPADKTSTCRVWTINPAVRTRFADRRRSEATRKGAIVTMLRQRRKS